MYLRAKPGWMGVQKVMNPIPTYYSTLMISRRYCGQVCSMIQKQHYSWSQPRWHTGTEPLHGESCNLHPDHSPRQCCVIMQLHMSCHITNKAKQNIWQTVSTVNMLNMCADWLRWLCLLELRNCRKSVVVVLKQKIVPYYANFTLIASP